MRSEGGSLYSEECGPKRLEVTAAVIWRDGRLLITQRRKGTPLGGFWEFPGGKREAGETLESCLKRELREELGIEVSVGRELETVPYDYDTQRVLLHFFECTLLEGTPRPLGCQDLLWVPPGELPGYRFPPADTRLLARLKAAGRQGG